MTRIESMLQDYTQNMIGLTSHAVDTRKVLSEVFMDAGSMTPTFGERCESPQQ